MGISCTKNGTAVGSVGSPSHLPLQFNSPTSVAGRLRTDVTAFDGFITQHSATQLAYGVLECGLERGDGGVGRPTTDIVVVTG